MNCSCSAERCPHLEYLRQLVENNRKQQIAAPTQTECPVAKWIELWHLAKPYVQSTMKLATCFIETMLLLWVSFTRACLQMWLQILGSNRSAVAMFLFFCLSLFFTLVTKQPASLSR